MKFSKEIEGGLWCSAIIPDWLRAFDCRQEHSIPWHKLPCGRTLMGSEKAEADLNLLSFGVTPVSCHTYIDSRDASEQELRRQVVSMVISATTMKEEYEKVKRSRFKDKGHGGSVCYLPVAIVMSNFGWSVLCDKRVFAIKLFG